MNILNTARRATSFVLGIRPSIRAKNATRRGQSLVELSIVLPLLLVLTGGIVQIGTVIATRHTLIQIGRDLGRWVATQDATTCTDLATAPSPIAARADELAIDSDLMGYAPGTWTGSFTSFGYSPIPSSAPSASGVEIAWELVGSAVCPPDDSTMAAFVTLRLAHEAPVLIPGFDLVLAALPGLGSDGVLLITTSSEFRMEPQAEPAVTSP